jgi:hypothetical protein
VLRQRREFRGFASKLFEAGQYDLGRSLVFIDFSVYLYIFAFKEAHIPYVGKITSENHHRERTRAIVVTEIQEVGGRPWTCGNFDDFALDASRVANVFRCFLDGQAACGAERWCEEQSCKQAPHAVWARGGRPPLCQETKDVLLRIRSDRGCFVVFHVEHGIQLGDLEKIVNFLRQVQQLQFAAILAHGGECAHKFAYA